MRLSVILTIILFSMSLRIVSYNVNGLHNNVKCSNIVQWCKIFNADIVLLQETFLSSAADYDHFINQWGGKVVFSPSASNMSGGVCIAFRENLPINVSNVNCDNYGRTITTLCTLNNFRFRICNVHVPNQRHEKLAFLGNIHKYLSGNFPLIIGGDFNCVTQSLDRDSGSNMTPTDSGCDAMKDLILTLNLVDGYRISHPSKPGHTWFRANSVLSSRIDRIYFSKEFDISSAETSLLPYSDHNPVYVDCKPPQNSRKRSCYWKYNVSLNTDESFCKDLRHQYKQWLTLKPAFSSSVDWWEMIKCRVKELAIKHSVRIAEENRVKRRILQRHYLNSDLIDIDDMLRNEVRGAYIRSRAKYLEEGERPSSYFCRLENYRGTKKIIDSIEDTDGVVYNNDQGITNVFHNFYRKLYSQETNICNAAQEELLGYVNGRVSVEERDDLDLPISIGEMENALSRTAKNKSPGIDGLPYEFYQCFFDLIGPDLLNVYNDIFSGGILSDSQRIAVITLTPKKGNASSPNNWRPISLLNSDYKLLAKILQVRLSKVMNSIVNIFQTCAVPGRSIHNNLLIIRDVIDYCSLNDVACALLSIDQEKAFDKVDWVFLKKVLLKFGFGDNFIKWIAILYNDISSRLLINGELSKPVFISRGVRQGCPLSPLLYVLFMEPLACYINNMGGIKGFSLPGGNGLKVKFLQYADDATCIASNAEDICYYISAFKLFQEATGASVNMHKTQGFNLRSRMRIPVSFNINWSCESIKITGIVFGNDKEVLCNWSNKVDTAIKRLNMYKPRFLSLIGKVAVINTVIFPLFYFVAPVFRIPDSIVKVLNKNIFSFIWGSDKPDLVARKVMALPKINGGLGLDPFKDKMDGLFVKAFFPMFSNNPDIPVYLILARYFMSKSLRKIFPFIWSNSRPNAGVCTRALCDACLVLFKLYSRQNDFHSVVSKTKDIVNLLRPSNINIAAVRHNPQFPWPKIWRLVCNPILDNKLCDFQWRLAHNVLYSGERIKDWGMGDGLCPCVNCNCIETIKHIFLECPKVRPVISWIKLLVKMCSGLEIPLSFNLFLYGFPKPCSSTDVFNRIWYIFCASKFIMWKSRCVHVFQSKLHSSDAIIRMIVNHLKNRVHADKHRLSFTKFKSLWVDNKSFVFMVRDNLVFKFPPV